jgi:hypothetical protein
MRSHRTGNRKLCSGGDQALAIPFIDTLTSALRVEC